MSFDLFSATPATDTFDELDVDEFFGIEKQILGSCKEPSSMTPDDFTQECCGMKDLMGFVIVNAQTRCKGSKKRGYYVTIKCLAAGWPGPIAKWKVDSCKKK